MNRVINKTSNTPRWLIFAFDLFLSSLSIFMAYQLRFEFNIPDIEISILLSSFPLFILVRAASFYFGKIYAGIIKYTGAQDAFRIFTTLLIGTAILMVANFTRFYLYDQNYFFPLSILVIEFLLSCIGLIAYRIATKRIYEEATNPSKTKNKVVVYGAGEAGLITKRTLDKDAASKLQVIAFFDDDKKKSGKRAEGIAIRHSSELDEFLKRSNVSQLILAIQKPKLENKQKIIDTALANGVKVLNVPPVQDWIRGKLSFNQLKPIKIEDLLERNEIALDTAPVEQMINGKVILVTGAAGSIGAGIVKQLIKFNPKEITLFDQAESPLYELDLEIKDKDPRSKINVVIGDIRNPERVANALRTFKPEIVFHAAAYKHVPLMEDNPSESILTNVLGTKILADLSDKNGVESFVFISTDKAVNPTNVMGASKRIAEMYCQSFNEVSKTNFITTRFGNVLGSNGSVIPLFKKQIERGGPLTITHEKINRFFMTISEACQLVLEAGAMGKGGEIFIFDMGQPVKIIDLAKNMIRLSGLEPKKDIEIKVTGLRPGEKIFEELLANEENTVPTHHKKIMVAKVRPNDYEKIKIEVDDLITLFRPQDNFKIVRKMKDLVPEFKSQNSDFEKLD